MFNSKEVEAILSVMKARLLELAKTVHIVRLEGFF